MKVLAHSSRPVRLAARSLAAGVVALAISLATPTGAARADADSTPWAAGGFGATLVSDGTGAAPELEYAVRGFQGSWTLFSLANTDGTVTLPYTWSGFHSFFNVRAHLEAYVSGPSGNRSVVLVDAGPANCCSSPSGGFLYTGTVTLPVHAGDVFGFRLSGSNSDSAMTLNGDFLVGTPAPTLQLPGDQVAEATGPAGATVSWTATATDTRDGTDEVTCTPASGSTFPLGTTTVTCSARNSRGYTADGGFTVTVRDTTAPDLALPGDLTVDATGPDGAVTSWTASANDTVDGAIVPTCSPGSGATLPIGTTQVTCSARDAAGNTATGAFVVTVRGAADQAAALATLVDGAGPGKSLAGKVRQVRAAIDAGDTAGALSMLRAFDNEVRAQSGKSISPATAASLLAAADRLSAVLGG